MVCVPCGWYVCRGAHTTNMHPTLSLTAHRCCGLHLLSPPTGPAQVRGLRSGPAVRSLPHGAHCHPVHLSVAPLVTALGQAFVCTCFCVWCVSPPPLPPSPPASFPLCLLPATPHTHTHTPLPTPPTAPPSPSPLPHSWTVMRCWAVRRMRRLSDQNPTLRASSDR